MNLKSEIADTKQAAVRYALFDAGVSGCAALGATGTQGATQWVLAAVAAVFAVALALNSYSYVKAARKG